MYISFIFFLFLFSVSIAVVFVVVLLFSENSNREHKVSIRFSAQYWIPIYMNWESKLVLKAVWFVHFQLNTFIVFRCCSCCCCIVLCLSCFFFRIVVAIVVVLFTHLLHFKIYSSARLFIKSALCYKHALCSAYFLISAHSYWMILSFSLAYSLFLLIFLYQGWMVGYIWTLYGTIVFVKSTLDLFGTNFKLQL